MYNVQPTKLTARTAPLTGQRSQALLMSRQHVSLITAGVLWCRAESSGGPSGFERRQGARRSVSSKVRERERKTRESKRQTYGHAPFHSSPQRGHKQHTRCCRVQHLREVASPFWPSIKPCIRACACERFFILRGSYTEMICSGAENTRGKQSTCRTSWHLCSPNTNLGWRYETNPDRRPPSLAPPRHLADGSALSLTSWQPERRLAAPGRRRSSSRWPDGGTHGSFFLYGILPRYITNKRQWV